MRDRLGELRQQLLRPFRWFAALDPESRAGAGGLGLIALGFGGVGPAAFVPGFLLSAVGLRGALPILNPFVAIAAIAGATVITVVGLLR